MMRKSPLLIALLLLALLAAMATKSLLVAVPEVRTAASPSGFNESRARDRLARILGDERPHPADTAANDVVRERLLAELRAIGLRPQVRDQIACNEIYKARGVTCARVRNVVATIGPESGRSLLLNAHYDSTAAGPGAGDDGAGVATLLEVASILRREQLRRPVILLFNEGEELGLIGARTFLADPLSHDVDSLINLEARGVSGPVNMFETSVPNAAAVVAFARAVAHPVANSLATDVYRLMPNYTDVNSFATRGWLTLNFAMIGNETRYHSPGDNLAALDPRSLQHMGDQTLAVARDLSRGVPQASGNRIFMDVLGHWLVELPQAIGMVLLGALLIGFAWLAWRRRALGRGLAVIGGGVLLGTALAWLGTTAVGIARPGMFWRAYPVWTYLAVYASALAAAVAVLASIGRTLDSRQLRAAYWLAFLAFGAAVAVVAPRGIIYFLFPPLAFAFGVVAGRQRRHAEQAAAWIACVLLYLTWGAMVGQLEELLNQGPMWIFAPLGLLVAMPVLVEAKPLITETRARTAIGIAALVALAGWLAAAAAPAYSEDRQQQFVIEHVTDIATGRSKWSILNDLAPLPERFNAAGKWRLGKLPYSDRKRWLASAPTARGLAAPAIQIVGRRVAGGARRVTVRIQSNGAETVALVAPKDARIVAAGTGAFVRSIDRRAAGDRYVVRCFGRSCDGLAMDIVIAKAGPIDVIVLGSRSGLPASAKPLVGARPRFARPQYSPDATITISRLRL
ncbi:MAG: M20/M25/M40 family metallo-hydrolase [Sphingomicrobium sp.]